MTAKDKNGRVVQPFAATIADVGRHFGVSQRTVRRWCIETDIPHRRIGKTLRFNLDVVDTWARRGTVADEIAAAQKRTRKRARKRKRATDVRSAA